MVAWRGVALIDWQMGVIIRNFKRGDKGIMFQWEGLVIILGWLLSWFIIFGKVFEGAGEGMQTR